MKIALFGATGQVGSQIAQEALNRGHQVTAISRNGSQVPNAENLQGNLNDQTLVQQVANNHDVIVNASGPSRAGDAHQEWLDGVANLINNAQDARVLQVGGAGTLQVNDAGDLLVDQPDFPELYQAEARTQGQALQQYRDAQNLNWAYFSPAPMLASGERTGQYTLGNDNVIGQSISTQDYAVALIDELENQHFQNTRFTAVN